MMLVSEQFSGDTPLLIHDRVQLVNRLAVEKNLTSAS